MAKERRVSLRLSDATFKKINAIRNGKSINRFFEDLIENAEKKEVEDANTFLKLMQKIDASDLSKLVQKVDTIIEMLNTVDTAKVNERVEKFLKRILYESVRANVGIEEFARRRLMRTDLYQEYLRDIEKRMQTKGEK